MKNIVFWASAILIVSFWPIAFVLANTQDWFIFLGAASVLLFDWFLYLKNFKYHYFLYLFLPLIHPVYLAFPVIAAVLNIKDLKRIPLVFFTAIFIVISMFSWKTFYAYSIFTPDPLASDTLIKKISLIPNRNLARIYENKTTVPLEKYKSNTFTSLDLNNFFFALHPRESGATQNINKYSFLTIIPFLLGLFFLPGYLHKKWVLGIFVAAILSVAFINNQDRFDMFICVPISLICLSGLDRIRKCPGIYSWAFFLAFIPVGLFELARVIIFK
jgi:hypothetical protein